MHVVPASISAGPMDVFHTARNATDTLSAWMKVMKDGKPIVHVSPFACHLLLIKQIKVMQFRNF